MKPALIDTNILSFFFPNHSLVIERFQAYLKEYDKINISIITYYEIVSGLKHRDAQKQLTSFQEFVSYNMVLPLTTSSALTLSGLKTRRFYREFQSISLSYPSFRHCLKYLGSCPDFLGPGGRNHI
ncbi:PIN domain-containing protein [Dolichospermum compactum]|uniref:PilT-like protein n=1 Tax=Dolichospermum compactum NIES-806 TaxID=1973481 RepID=A0A1Z4V2T8_9CYAN|nr:PIN domain-containing protein [Dolichospermum compactum]BAZ85798.1 PilT-like protein [Dolichospermum compactum NIES-806]